MIQNENSEQHLQFRSFLGSMSLIGVILDTDGRITLCNDFLLELTGWKSEEVINRNWFDLFVPPESRDIIKDVIFKRSMVTGEVPARSENEIITHEGERRVIAWNNTVLREEDGSITGVASIGQDITEDRQLESQMDLLRSALEAAANTIVITDRNGVMEWVNPAFTTVTGYSFEEAIGQNSRLLKSGKHDEKFYRNLWEVISSGTAWHGEIINRRKDGVFYTEDMTITPVTNPKGGIEHFIAVKQDVTERKNIEAQLLRAQRMESIGTLASGVAHDLNNILTPIVTSIEILKAISDSPQAMKILETIEGSAKRAADIVRQVLSFEHGLEGQRVEVQLNHLLKNLETIIQSTFPKDIRSQFSIPNDTWTIFGDPTQVHQILLNLCVNARDAMPQGGSLSVSIENFVLDEQYAAMNLQAKPGRYVRISVTDSGTGIPPDMLDRIFDPFFTTKALGKGTGLGLSSVMAIVKNHEGVVKVSSEPGKGATFKVYLPVSELFTEDVQYQTARLMLPRGKGETVLVIDDEASILFITRQTLEAFGYHVFTATNGADAVAVYSQHQNEIAVVLTDMMMPVMDGSATIYALMRINPAIKIIAASGLNSNENAAKASGFGVKQFLTKPYTARNLLKTLREILDQA